MRSQLLIYILCVLVVCACNEKQGQRKKYNQDSSDVQLIATPQVTEPAPTTTALRPPSPIVDYNFIPNPQYTPWSGVRMAQARWQDLAGNHVVIISILHQYYWNEKKPELKKYMQNEDETEATELYATHYIIPKDSAIWIKHWQYNNVKLSCCDVSHTYLPGTLQVTDVDSNNVLETVFSYHTTEGTQAIDFVYPGKLVFYTDTTPYTIAGNIGIMRNHLQQSHISFSGNFNKLAPVYKGYLAQQWDKTIALRDSMDTSLKKLWE